MQVINAVATFERDLLIERTHAGIRKGRGQGVWAAFGLNGSATRRGRGSLDAGIPVAQIARDMKTSGQTIMQVRETVKVEAVAVA